MAKVGIKRLRPGHDKKHGSQRQEPDHAMAEKKTYAMNGIERVQDLEVLRDVPDAGRGKREEPHQSDGAKKRCYARGAVRLHCEQTEQDQDGQRDDIRLQRRGRDLEALDRRQHRQRRRDHRVAVKQGSADHAERDDPNCAASADGVLGKRHQRERPAFAVIVRAQQDDHILDADHQNERPNDQGQNAENGLFARRRVCAAGGKDGLAEGIERARADVAVNDPDRAEGQRPECALRKRGRLGAVGGGKMSERAACCISAGVWEALRLSRLTPEAAPRSLKWLGR